MSLPTRTKIVESVRDVQVFDLALPTDPPCANRIAVLWDSDRDERPLDVLAALHYRDLRVRPGVVALAESRGVISCWFDSPQFVAKARTANQVAGDAALRPHDHWADAPLIIVPIRDGVLDRDALLPNCRLLVVPNRYNLGLVQS